MAHAASQRETCHARVAHHAWIPRPHGSQDQAFLLLVALCVNVQQRALEVLVPAGTMSPKADSSASRSDKRQPASTLASLFSTSTRTTQERPLPSLSLSLLLASSYLHVWRVCRYSDYITTEPLVPNVGDVRVQRIGDHVR
jgi:hypothetical protein